MGILASTSLRQLAAPRRSHRLLTSARRIRYATEPVARIPAARAFDSSQGRAAHVVARPEYQSQMQFMTVSRRRTESYSEAEFAQHLEAEAERARTLYSEGFIRQIWNRGDAPGACLLVEANDEEAVRTQLGTLPLVRNGMLEVTAVIPLLPYRGFAAR